MKSFVLGVLALSLLGFSRPARASGVLDRAPRYSGSIELRAPVWSGVTNSAASNLNALEMAGDLRLSNVLGPIGLRISGVHTFHQAGIFKAENKLNVGIEVPLPGHLTAFGYWDRRYDVNVDRVFVGVRYGFGGRI